MKRPWAINQLNEGEAEILLYGYIGSDEVNANDFTQEFKKLEASCNLIKLRINSGGGSIFEGLAIFNVIKNSTCQVHAYIDGLAASMASVIILACDKIYMSKVAMLMTHRPSGAAMGNPDQLKSTASMLEQLEATLTQIYAQRTGLTDAEVKAKYLGTSDNWMNANEALTAKIIDGIYDAPAKDLPPVPATMRNEQDLVNYFTNFLTNTDMKQIMLSAAALAALNITADAADATAVETAIARLAAKAQKTDELTAEVTGLKGKLQAAEEDAVNAKAESLVDAAVAANKIVAGDKAKWMKLAKADFDGTKDLLDGLTAVPTMEQRMQGHDSQKANADRLAKLSEMSAKDLYMNGHFEELKNLSKEVFKAKYKEFFGTEYAN